MMNNSKDKLDQQEKKIEDLANDIQPIKEIEPDSLAEATTVPLSDEALGGTPTQDEIDKASK